MNGLALKLRTHALSMEEEARLILSGAVGQEFREQHLILKGVPVRLRPSAPISRPFLCKKGDRVT